MALTIPLNIEGVNIPAAYVRVDSICGGKDQGWGATFGVYADDTHTHHSLMTIYRNFDYVDNAVLHQQAYEDLKTAYPEAVDS